jgi:hypothetical protein
MLFLARMFSDVYFGCQHGSLLAKLPLSCQPRYNKSKVLISNFISSGERGDLFKVFIFQLFLPRSKRQERRNYDIWMLFPLYFVPATEWNDMFLWFNTNKTNIKVPRRWNCGKRMEFLRFMAFDGGSLILIKFTYTFSIFIARWPVLEWRIYEFSK